MGAFRSLLAQGTGGDIKITPSDTSRFGALTNLSVGGIVSGAISLALVVAAVLFFFMLVIGGIRWITSGGDKGGTEEARKQITAALIGLVVVFAAWAIASLIEKLFGLSGIFSGNGLTIPTFTGK